MLNNLDVGIDCDSNMSTSQNSWYSFLDWTCFSLVIVSDKMSLLHCWWCLLPKKTLSHLSFPCYSQQPVILSYLFLSSSKIDQIDKTVTLADTCVYKDDKLSLTASKMLDFFFFFQIFFEWFEKQNFNHNQTEFHIVVNCWSPYRLHFQNWIIVLEIMT